MGLVVTSRPFSWASFYALNKHGYYKGHNHLEDVTDLIIISASRPTIRGNELVNVVSYPFDKPPEGLKSAKKNITYVCVKNVKPWKSLSRSYDWLSIDDLDIPEYKIILTVASRFMTTDGYKWFYSKFGQWPYKVTIELENLKGYSYRKGDVLNQEDLKRLYGSKSRREFEYCRSKGSVLGTNTLREMSNSELWRTFIGLGNRSSYLRQELDSNSEGNELLILGLNALCISVYEGNTNLRVGCYIFDSWIRDMSGNIDSKFKEILRLLCLN